MDIQKLVLKNFDVKKFKFGCNHPACKSKPDKEILIYEYATKKGLVKLYVCKKHSDISGFMKKIKAGSSKLIEKSVRNMGR